MDINSRVFAHLHFIYKNFNFFAIDLKWQLGAVCTQNI